MIIQEPYRIGDIVRCVKYIPHNNPEISVPKLGAVYTVRGWEDHFEGFGIYLEEIENPRSEQRFFNEMISFEPYFFWWQFEVIRQNPWLGDLRDGARGPDYFSMCLNMNFKELIKSALPEFGVYAMSLNSRERRKCIDLALHQYRNKYDISYILRDRKWYGVSYPEVYWLGFGPMTSIIILGNTILPSSLIKDGYTHIIDSKSTSSCAEKSLLENVIQKGDISIHLPKGISQIISVQSGAICRNEKGEIYFLNRDNELMTDKIDIIGWI